MNHLFETEMILVLMVVACEVSPRGGTHGGPGKISSQNGGEEDQDEPEGTHVWQGNKELILQ